MKTKTKTDQTTVEVLQAVSVVGLDCSLQIIAEISANRAVGFYGRDKLAGPDHSGVLLFNQ